MNSGLVVGATTIFSFGPCNLMMVREGLARGHVQTVLTIVWSSYIVLLASAYLLADELAFLSAEFRMGLTWLGVGILLGFAIVAVTSAIGPAAGDGRPEELMILKRRRLLYVLATIWLNPLVYVELLLMPAALCENFATEGGRLLFVGGFCAMATLGCLIYSFGGRCVGALVGSRRVPRALDLISGLLLAGLAISIAWSHRA